MHRLSMFQFIAFCHDGVGDPTPHDAPYVVDRNIELLRPLPMDMAALSRAQAAWERVSPSIATGPH